MKPLVCLVMLTSSGLAQTFQLGSSLNDVYGTFGVPKRWWEPQPEQYINSFEDYRAAVGIGAIVQDVYERETNANAYEIRLTRRADYRDPRFSPKTRLVGLDFLVSKPATFLKILRDIAVIQSI